MIDILLRVPAQIVFAFRCLSKYYRDLTQTDEFIRMHYDKHYEISLKTRPSILLHQSAINEYELVPYVISLRFESGCKVDEFNPPFKDEGKYLHFLGCQRGILCYNEDVNNLIFWNPITKVCRRSSCADTISKQGNYSYSCRGVRYFFRYDSVTDDFKVLKITRFVTLKGNNEYDCVVYSSKTDSWTRTGGFDHIRNDKGDRLMLDMIFDNWLGAEVFVEGCMHMLARFDSSVGEGRQVLAYDFSAQKFKLVPLPERSIHPKSNLSTMDGCLCLLLPFSWISGLEGWIMKDYEDGESWSTLFSIRSNSIHSSLHSNTQSTCLVVINGSPHLLIQTYYCGELELYTYDVNRKQLTNALSDLDDVQKEPLSRVLEDIYPTPQHYLFAPSYRQP